MYPRKIKHEAFSLTSISATFYVPRSHAKALLGFIVRFIARLQGSFMQLQGYSAGNYLGTHTLLLGKLRHSIYFRNATNRQPVHVACWSMCLGSCVLVHVSWSMFFGSCGLVHVFWFMFLGSCI